MHSIIARTVKSLAGLLGLILIVTVLTAILWIYYEILFEQDVPVAPDEKTALEIKKLRAETSPWARWFPWISTLLLPVVLAILVWWLNSAAARRAARFTTLVDARAQAYAKAFAILKPTAIYFPDPTGRDQFDRVITPGTCEKMGRELSDWYFGAGGVIMSKGARDACFILMLLLARAAETPTGKLASQTFKEHREKIPSHHNVEERRKSLVKKCREDLIEKCREDLKLPDEWRHWSDKQWEYVVDAYKFGDESKPENFADFIFIQTLASRFRTRLTNDIKSRLPPGG